MRTQWSLLASGEQRYIKAINNNNNVCLLCLMHLFISFLTDFYFYFYFYFIFYCTSVSGVFTAYLSACFVSFPAPVLGLVHICLSPALFTARLWSVCLSVSLFLSVSLSVSVSQSLCFCVCLTVCLSVSVSVCLCLSLSVSVSLFLCLSDCLSVCLCLSLSLSFSLCRTKH